MYSAGAHDGLHPQHGEVDQLREGLHPRLRLQQLGKFKVFEESPLSCGAFFFEDNAVVTLTLTREDIRDDDLYQAVMRECI
jgi:hypothetical protein